MHAFDGILCVVETAQMVTHARFPISFSICLRSMVSIRWNKPAFALMKRRMATKARCMRTLTMSAIGLFSTPDSWPTPSSVKAYGRYFMLCPLCLFKVAFCDLEREKSSQLSNS